jgi:hypothetical protein
MMALFFIVFGVMFLVITAMSVGVLMGRKPIAGSCGGMSALGMEVACDICGGDTSKCEKEKSGAGDAGKPAESLAYDASRK